MSRHKKLICLGVLLLVLSGAAYSIALQAPTSHQVYQEHVFTVSPPANYTEAQEIAYVEAVANGHPLPSGWVKTGEEGDVTATLTGVSDPVTHEQQITVTVRDDTAHMDSASLILNDSQVCTATRATGGIIDRSGSALATMSTLVPATPPYKLEVRWVSATGVKHSHMVWL